MAPKKKPSMSQKGLTGAGFWPMLSKTAVAVGKYCSVPGKFWDGCPSADKETRYKCSGWQQLESSWLRETERD
eukprot:6551117-Prymnesium_polylepis.1